MALECDHALAARRVARAACGVRVRSGGAAAHAVLLRAARLVRISAAALCCRDAAGRAEHARRASRARSGDCARRSAHGERARRADLAAARAAAAGLVSAELHAAGTFDPERTALPRRARRAE